MLVAIPMTIADWRLNPSGVFRNEQGTHWSVVAETALSWFWPVAILGFVASVATHVLIKRRLAKRYGAPLGGKGREIRSDNH